MEELNEIKKQFDELMAKAEEIVKKNEKGDERWRARCGEEYYYIVGNDFEVYSDSDDWAPRDDMLYGEGNYFQTEEEARKVSQHFKDYLILRADAKGYEPKGFGPRCLYVYWDYDYEGFNTMEDSPDRSGLIYFETSKDAEASIEKHGDIWKRYLGVEE